MAVRADQRKVVYLRLVSLSKGSNRVCVVALDEPIPELPLQLDEYCVDGLSAQVLWQVASGAVLRHALATMPSSIFLVRASELANTTRTCHVGFNTRPIPSLKIYAQISSWMT